MPINDRESGDIFTPPPSMPEQPVPSQPALPPGIRRMPPGLGMPVPQQTRPTPAIEGRHTGYVEGPQSSLSNPAELVEPISPVSHRGRKIVAGLFIFGLLSGGGAAADMLLTGGKMLAKIGIGSAPRLHDPEVAAPATSSGALPEVATTAPSPSATTATPSPTTRKPTATKSASVAPAVPGVLNQNDCVPELSLTEEIDQLLMLPIDSKSDVKTLTQMQATHPTEYILMSYPTNADGTFNVSGVKTLKSVDKTYPAMVAIDQEGGQVTRIPDKNLTGLDAISATKLSTAALEEQLTADYANLVAKGIDVNLAPVADISSVAGQAYGRMFRSSTDAQKYLPIYNKVAQQAGLKLTYKHFLDLLAYGNTDLGAVKTAPYAQIEKSGALNAYGLLKGTNNLVMMSSATTPGLPNTALDNGKIDVLNPAAYDALDKLAGDKVIHITDDLGAKAVNAVVPVDLAVRDAIKAGADIALVVTPDKGKTIADQLVSIEATVTAAVSNESLPRSRVDDAFLKVIASKGLNACGILKAENTTAYQALLHEKQVKANSSTPTASPTTLHPSNQPAATIRPSIATTKPASTPTTSSK